VSPPPSPFLILPMDKVSKNFCNGDFYRRLTYFCSVVFSQNIIALWFIYGILGYNNIFIHMQISIQEKNFFAIFFLVNNSKFKCFVEKKIGGFWLFVEAN
jgi:hypothetical protein